MKNIVHEENEEEKVVRVENLKRKNLTKDVHAIDMKVILFSNKILFVHIYIHNNNTYMYN